MDYGDERLPERFWSKVAVEEGGCWLWTASYSKTTGYGWYRLNGKSINPHRLVCYLEHGEHPSDKGLALHSCDNRKCVAPGHLRWGSPADNSQDMVQRGRTVKPRVTHCPEGHEFTSENTYIPPGGTSRRCRECHRRWWREWNLRRSAPGYAPNRTQRVKENRRKPR